MKHNFPDFFEDRSEFERVKKYWYQLCWAILSKYCDQENWQQWLNDEAYAGENFDNFPICSLISREGSKGVIIYQHDPRQVTESNVSAWIKDYERESDEFWASEYLVFNCSLPEEGTDVFTKLFEA